LSTHDDSEIGALRERLRRLEAAIEATALGLWEWDVRTGGLTWNDRNRELFGVASDRKLVIQDYPDLVHPSDRELVRTAYLETSERPEGGVFSIEYRTLIEPDGKARWVLTRGRVMKDAEGVRLVVGSSMDITDRKTAEQRRNLVLRELAHRAKNGILILMTIVAQTAKGATGVKDFEAMLTARLQAMADSQDLVTQTSGRSLRLAGLLDRVLTPFDASRFDIDARLREIDISNDMVVGVALLLHELSTNAVKYGALSEPSGRVELGFAEGSLATVQLQWRERGGPVVQPVTRRGFGSRLIDISLRNNGGRVEAHFDPAGFRADIHLPVASA
jgi:PAS domain S-box-containing protein